MSYKDDSKVFNDKMKYRVVCKCNHVQTMSRADRTICSVCGRWVYRTPAIEFKYRLKSQIIKKRGGE